MKRSSKKTSRPAAAQPPCLPVAKGPRRSRRTQPKIAAATAAAAEPVASGSGTGLPFPSHGLLFHSGSEEDFSSDSDSDKEFQPADPQSSSDEEDDDDEALDYVSVHNTSTESEGLPDDEPLSTFRDRNADKNKPGTKKFFWRDRENVHRKHDFQGVPGVKDPDLHPQSILDIFRAFMTLEIWDHVVKETNR